MKHLIAAEEAFEQFIEECDSPYLDALELVYRPIGTSLFQYELTEDSNFTEQLYDIEELLEAIPAQDMMIYKLENNKLTVIIHLNANYKVGVLFDNAKLTRERIAEILSPLLADLKPALASR